MGDGPEFVKLDVRILDGIESVICLDCVEPPGVIIPLVARLDARDSHRWPPAPDDPALDDDVSRVQDGEWLTVREIADFQRLRGWNRTRYGQVKVRASHLERAVDTLGVLLMSAFDPECDDMLSQLDYPEARDLREAVSARLAKDGRCGECSYCQLSGYQAECNAALDSAGVERGVEYRVSCLGQSVARANREVYGYCIFCNRWDNACTDPAHLAATYPDQEVA